LSPGQASYVIDRLVSDRRISAGEINRYVSDMHHEISELEQRLASLRNAAGGPSAAPVRRGPGRPPKSATAAGAAAPAAPRGRRRGRPPASASAGAAPSAAPAAAPRGRRGRRGRASITPEQLASRQLQGRYLGLIRQIPATRRGQFQKIAKEQDRQAAIREMEIYLKK
jgi:hypothetical protein